MPGHKLSELLVACATEKMYGQLILLDAHHSFNHSLLPSPTIHTLRVIQPCTTIACMGIMGLAVRSPNLHSYLCNKSLSLHTSTHNSKFEIHGGAQIKSMEQPGLTHLACTFLL